MIADKHLETVEISDYANNEIFFVADSSLSQIFGLPFLIPIISLILFSVSSFFLPNSESIQYQQFQLPKSEGENFFSINNSISNISSVYQFLHVNFSLIDPPIDSNVAATTHSIFTLNKNIIKTITKTIKLQKASDSFTILDEGAIIFDNVIIETNFSTVAKDNQLYQISVSSMNPSFSISILFCRIAFSLFLVPYLVSDVIHIIQNSNSGISYEQILTIALSSVTILYNDPFYTLQIFFPVFYNNFLLIVFHDSYLAFLLFYIFSLYSFFGIKKEQENSFARFSFNLVLMIASISALLWFDLSSSLESIVFLQRHQDDVNHSIFIHHFIFLIFSTIVISIRIFITKSSMVESQAQRFRYYTYSSLLVICLLFIFCTVKFFLPNMISDGFDIIFPMILFTGYAMFMEFGHEDTEISEDKAYTAPEDFPSDDHLGLGAEEDPEQLSKSAKP